MDTGLIVNTLVSRMERLATGNSSNYDFGATCLHQCTLRANQSGRSDAEGLAELGGRVPVVKAIIENLTPLYRQHGHIYAFSVLFTLADLTFLFGKKRERQPRLTRRISCMIMGAI